MADKGRARWQELVGSLRAELTRQGQDPSGLEDDYGKRRLALPLAASGGVRFALTVSDDQLNGDLTAFARAVCDVYQRQAGTGTRGSDATSTSDTLQTWLSGVMSRFQPDRIEFGPADTLAAVIQRIIDEEEAKVRATPDELQPVKLQALEELRKQFA